MNKKIFLIKILIKMMDWKGECYPTYSSYKCAGADTCCGISKILKYYLWQVIYFQINLFCMENLISSHFQTLWLVRNFL